MHSGVSDLVYVVPFLVAIAMIFVLVDAPTDLDWATTSTAFPQTGAHYIARFHRLRVIACGFVFAGLVVYGAASQDFVAMMKFSGIVFLIDATYALRSWRMGTRGLRVLAHARAKASLDGGALYVSDGDQEVQLATSPWLLARARRHALPKAKI